MNSIRGPRAVAASDGTTGVAPAVKAGEAESRRMVFLRWLRKTHGWIGLWAAALGFLFGTTGVLLNHRAVMKIPAAQVQEATVQVPLPQPKPASAEAMAAWLESELRLGVPASRVRAEPARPVAWGDKALTQPARWTAVFSTPRLNVQAEYWEGNAAVSVKRTENNVFGVLNNFHKSAGVGVGWILLADTLGAGIAVLSLSGVLLWALVNRRRAIGLAIALVSLASAITLAVAAL